MGNSMGNRGRQAAKSGREREERRGWSRIKGKGFQESRMKERGSFRKSRGSGSRRNRGAMSSL